MPIYFEADPRYCGLLVHVIDASRNSNDGPKEENKDKNDTKKIFYVYSPPGPVL